MTAAAKIMRRILLHLSPAPLGALFFLLAALTDDVVFGIAGLVASKSLHEHKPDDEELTRFRAEAAKLLGVEAK